jgi:glycosyltransferase involved in cell wall biosynthesis
MVVPRVARRAAAVITHSEHARSDIQRLLRVASSRVHLVQPGAGRHFRVLPADEVRRTVPPGLPTSDHWVVTLGAVDPRKNTARVLEAFARFRASGCTGHRLVVVGLDHDSSGRLLQRARELGIAEHVTLRGFVTEPELVALYNGAQMFVYASLYEGFGLPVLEAMSCGTPVIASCRTSVPEIAGGAALLVDPTDVDALAGAMRTIAGDESTRQRLRELGLSQAAAFSWEQAAADVVRVYETVAGS